MMLFKKIRKMVCYAISIMLVKFFNAMVKNVILALQNFKQNKSYVTNLLEIGDRFPCSLGEICGGGAPRLPNRSNP